MTNIAISENNSRGNVRENAAQVKIANKHMAVTLNYKFVSPHLTSQHI